ncbi:MAG: putative MerR-family transcriptional regulator [Frankiales bacterium]|nr:putative MerR-family transcriptional regulator [Frankiales bacterium]
MTTVHPVRVTEDSSTDAAPAEMTIDQLAARTGLTVRNLRAYAARGLLPAPRLVGRTGYYGEDHVDRLTLVREMLGEGYTLAKIQETLAGRAGGGATGALALHRTLMSPWLPDTPEETDLRTLAARAGVGTQPEVVDQLVAMGAVERLDEDRLRVLDPTLLAAGLQVVRLGIPPLAVVVAQRQVVELVEKAADTYVAMFRDSLWRDFADRGAPRDEWDRMQAIMESLQPVAAQALLASFRTAMASAIAASLADEIAALDLPVDPAPPPA